MPEILSAGATVDVVTNLYDVLADGWAPRLDAAMLIDPDGSERSYQDIVDLASRMATVLSDFSVEPGDRVMVQVDKSPEAVALYLACLRTGAVHLPVNTAYTSTEVEYFREDADPSLFVCSAAASPAGSSKLTLEADGSGSLSDLAAVAAPTTQIVARADDDLAALLYTSGTTGRPKGAMLTHKMLIANAQALHRAWGITADDTLVHALPIFHVHGLFVALHCAMLSGCPIVFLPRFDSGAIIDAFKRGTMFMGVPTHYTRLLADDRLDSRSCDGMRLFTSGSAPMSDSTHLGFRDRTGQRIVERYGLSEVCILTSSSLDGEAGSVGLALEGVELRITDDAGTRLPVGDTGGVEARPTWGFTGYWNNAEATAEATTSDDWFITGDVGHLDPENRLVLEGRSSDMIISGGLNVYPKEIELVLDECDGVSESAVIGVPHGDFGEIVLGVIVADGDFTEPDLEGRLARFKQPSEYVVVESLPRNAMGKVLKSQLRARFGSDGRQG
jgi:malonyl-CoA/methylmalonyl-CoA synthetase